MKHFILIVIILTLFNFAKSDVAARESIPITPQIITASLISDKDTLTKNEQTLTLGLTLKHPEGWHSYWRNAGDSGMATSVTLTLPEGVTASEILWPMPSRLATGDITSYGYSGDITLPFSLTITRPLTTPITIKAQATWLACKDSCIPETADLILSLPISATTSFNSHHQTILKTALTNTPKPLTQSAYFTHSNTQIILSIPRTSLPKGTISHVDLFPITENTLKSTPPVSFIEHENALDITLNTSTSKQVNALDAVIILTQQNTTTSWSLHATQGTTATTNSLPHTQAPPITDNLQKEFDFGQFLNVILLALLGGLVLNVMPCVLPVLSLKLISLTYKATQSRTTALKHGIAYTLGVLTCFTILGVTLVLIQQTGSSIGWGFQLQSPYFVTALAIIMMLVGLNLIGAFTLPDLLGTLGHNLTAQDNPVGSFFTGALAALAATPCTAPFMAPAIGFALTQSPLGAMLIFESLGFGMAAPYLLISVIPALRRFIPKAGAWMITFKQCLAFPMFATVAWLLWVMVRGACSYALAPAMAILILTAFAVWVGTHLTHKLIKTILLTLSFIAIAYATNQLNQLPALTTSSNTFTNQSFNEKTLQSLRQNGNAVFVDATADWCLTCQVNEASTLSREQIRTHFKNQNITVLTADWTRKDDNITRYLRSLGRQGVPVYVFYPPHGEPILLPQILTVDTVLQATCIKGDC